MQDLYRQQKFYKNYTKILTKVSDEKKSQVAIFLFLILLFIANISVREVITFLAPS